VISRALLGFAVVLLLAVTGTPLVWAWVRSAKRQLPRLAMALLVIVTASFVLLLVTMMANTFAAGAELQSHRLPLVWINIGVMLAITLWGGTRNVGPAFTLAAFAVCVAWTLAAATKTVL